MRIKKMYILLVCVFVVLFCWMVFDCDYITLEQRHGLPYRTILIPFKNKQIFDAGNSFMKRLANTPAMLDNSVDLPLGREAQIQNSERKYHIADFRLASITKIDSGYYLDYWVYRQETSGNRFETSSRLYVRKNPDVFVVYKYNAMY